MADKEERILGNKYGMLTVIGLDHIKEYISPKGQKHKREYYLCKCDCGNQTIVYKSHLKSGTVRSCGCLRVKNLVKSCQKHGMKHTRIYDMWSNIKSRCFDKKSPCYIHYGGRGITVCDEWKNDFITFYNWAINNGYDNNLSIDRINNDGNYEPSNCHFVTQKEQGRNKRNNRLITYKGQTHCLAEWAEILGVKYSTLLYRFRRGWSAEAALNALLEVEK